MRKITLFIFSLLFVMQAYSQTLVNGIWYTFSGTEATVVSGSGCTGSIIIPSQVSYNSENYTVTSIKELAFYNCSGLTSVSIPNTVTSIGAQTFCECSGLTVIDVGTQNPSYSSLGGVLYSKAKDTLVCYPAGKQEVSFTVPNLVVRIGEYAFSCSKLTSITIPNSVTSIGEYAFSWSKLISITIPNSIKSIESYVFSHCSGLTSITIPNSVTNIGNSAFSYCQSLTSLSIPNSITNIGYSAFYYCNKLTSITIPNSVTSIGTSAFYECYRLTSLTISNSVKSIGRNTFYNCNRLISITIPDSVTSIDESAFFSCSSLTSITIPNSVISIGNSAFQSCSGLTSVSIGNSVKSIGDKAFIFCNKLTSLTIPNSVTSIGVDAFFSCSKLDSIYALSMQPAICDSSTFCNVPICTCILWVPAGSKTLYKAATAWKNFLNIVEERASAYKITASTGANGSIAPLGDSLINYGSGITYTFTPNNGYKVDSLLIDGVNIPDSISGGTYTFNNVQADHSIVVSFKLNQYTVSASVNDTNGSISHVGDSLINYGSSITYTFTPNNGYQIDEVLIDGINDPEAVTNGIYTFSNITVNHNIVVSFKLKQYTISASAGLNGSINPMGDNLISHGNSMLYTITPDTNYQIDQVLIDGVNNPQAVENEIYVFINVAANHSIEVSFKPKQYTISSSIDSENGTISPIGDSLVSHDNNITYVFSANSGYKIDSLLVDGVNVPDSISGGSYTFCNVQADHSIVVSFKSTTSIESLETPHATSLKVYPNPTTGKLVIEYEISRQARNRSEAELGKANDGRQFNNSTNQQLNSEIYDIAGKQVGTYSITGSETLIDISHLAKGVYFIKVGTEVRKVVKQ